ncbi:thiamine pyrophosphate-dependent dehydrogenase E1 component subunit alpha [Mameliella alba]|uniref:thiamine pyrophosphate-dependent dehydrogenase E1 component subunit alpha n=1 Tax=Mameliella alba TaxID=561184 RepID=UPI001C97EB00|nr:thiamine pyrophosphate-dependent dehydrogenase E1 component subunit alpha [Mameliella alba]MBY6120397.1 thiamine pyrophosphate-dependent dehydrogenase E1 component subunit alpha [Mameliella alba]
MRTSNESELLEMYRQMVLIRVAEEALLRLFEGAEMPGFIHSYIGEEATGVGVCHALQKQDVITSTHRGHGHVIAKGCDLNAFFAELYGRAAGYCKGKGGSMHVADLDLGIYGANGIVGGGVPIAAGAALASSIRKDDRVSVAFMGDGASDIGPFHESLNLAAIWNLPVVFVVENNGFADFIRQSDHQKIDKISIRATAYGIEGVTVDGNDVEAVHEATREAVARARRGEGPTLLECVTYRWRGHFEGDPQPYRTQDEVEDWKKRDPIKATEARLAELGLADDAAMKAIVAEMTDKVEAAIEFARAAPKVNPEDALEDVYTDLKVEGWT